MLSKKKIHEGIARSHFTYSMYSAECVIIYVDIAVPIP